VALADLQRLLAEALPQRDPAAALRPPSVEAEAQRGPAGALSLTELETVQRLPEDGLLLTSLVLVKLRIQQLLKNPIAAKLFEESPEAFARLFEQYHTACPMTDFFPEGEGKRFEAWLQRAGFSRRGEPG
jgi:hypothetical protein